MIIHGQFYDGIVGKPDLDDALEHYGVLGMKWGVRKNPDRAYSKATKKSKKLSKKIEKAKKKTAAKKTIVDKIFNSNITTIAAFGANQGPEFLVAKHLYNKKKRK